MTDDEYNDVVSKIKKNADAHILAAKRDRAQSIKTECGIRKGQTVTDGFYRTFVIDKIGFSQDSLGRVEIVLSGFMLTKAMKLRKDKDRAILCVKTEDDFKRL